MSAMCPPPTPLSSNLSSSSASNVPVSDAPPDSSLSSSHNVLDPIAIVESHHQEEEDDNEEPTTQNDDTQPDNACTYLKYTYSMALLLFSTVIVMALIWNQETQLSQDVHPSFAFIVIWLALLWLSVVEGGQGAVVGLVPIAKDLYQESHPVTHRVTTAAHCGDNLDRYLIGRQFLVVLLVFLVNQCGAPLDDAAVLNMPNVWQQVFVQSSLAVILLTVMVGQLHGQINASDHMLDYSNHLIVWITLWVSRALEASGAMHAVYLLQDGFAWWSGKPVESREPARNLRQQVLFWLRVVLSVALLGFSVAVTLAALFQEQTDLWSGVPPWASVIIFFGLLLLLGLLEGTQIAVFAVSRLPLEQQDQAPAAMRVLNILFAGRNIARFMIGRQMLVTLLTFVLARISNISVSDDDANVFGVSDGVQAFFNTGLLGAVIVTILGSISWKLIGSAFPVVFLSNPLVYFLLRLSLLLEASGVCAGAWVLALLHRTVARWQRDEIYVGTPDERTQKNQPDAMDSGSVSVHLRETTSQVGSSRYLLVDDNHSRRSSAASHVAASSSKLLLAAAATSDASDDDSVPRELHIHSPNRSTPEEIHTREPIEDAMELGDMTDGTSSSRLDEPKG